MFCIKCGTALPVDGGFCPSCGENNASQLANANANAAAQQPVNAMQETVGGENQQMPVYAQPVEQQQFYAQPVQPPKKKKTGAIVAIAVSVVLAIIIGIVGIAFAVEEAAKDELQSQLLRDWSRVESGNSIYYTLELDFTHSTITYDFDSYYVDKTIAVYNYEVISGDQIKVDGTVYTITFNDEKTMMTMRPALTNSDSYENWFHLNSY